MTPLLLLTIVNQVKLTLHLKWCAVVKLTVDSISDQTG